MGKKKAEDEELVQLAQFPAWVVTEEDMEKFFKQQKTKVTRKDSGNGGVNPRTGRKFKPPSKEEEKVRVVNSYEGGTWKKKAEDEELVQLTQFPAWVVTEDDMEKFFKQQKTKVVRRDS